MEDFEDYGLDLNNSNEPATDRYSEAFSKYNIEVDENSVKKAVESIKKDVLKEKTASALKAILSCIDLTSLKSTDSEDSILALAEKVNDCDERFPDLPSVASICVYPNFADIISKSVEVDNVKTCCVAGGFPSSQTFTEIKIAEVSLAIHEGADEIDIVLPIGKFLDGDYEGISDELEEIKSVCDDKTLKIILETDALQNLSNVKKASILAMYSGADFIKTSTGKEYQGADPASFYVMCKAVKEYAEETGRIIGVKAAGGIVSTDDAVLYYAIVKNILGKDWLTKERFRIGASRLANNLISEITGKDIKQF
jgi:deoxyribose-phosphate aldolase